MPIYDFKTYKLHSKDGFPHRLDGPAFYHIDGSKEWWIEGRRHREEGPAVDRSNGHKEWWINGRFVESDEPSVITEHGKKQYAVGYKLYNSLWLAKFMRYMKRRK